MRWLGETVSDFHRWRLGRVSTEQQLNYGRKYGHRKTVSEVIGRGFAILCLGATGTAVGSLLVTQTGEEDPAPTPVESVDESWQRDFIDNANTAAELIPIGTTVVSATLAVEGLVMMRRGRRALKDMNNPSSLEEVLELDHDSD